MGFFTKSDDKNNNNLNMQNTVQNNSPQYQQPSYLQQPQAEPQYQQPMYQQPMYQQPMYQQPMYQQPSYLQQPQAEPQYQQPSYLQQPQAEPQYQQPIQSQYQQPMYQQPAYNQTYQQSQYGEFTRQYLGNDLANQRTGVLYNNNLAYQTYQPYQPNVTASMDQTMIESPEIARQKSWAANEYGDKFVTKGKLPKQLRKEVHYERARNITIFTLGIIAFVYAIISMLAKQDKYINFLWINSSKYVTGSWFLIALLLITSTFAAILAMTDYSLLVSNVKKCKRDAKNYGTMYVPYFIKRNYRKLITRYIYANWICFSLYVVLSIVIGIQCWLRANPTLEATFAGVKFSLNNPVHVSDQDVLITCIVLLTVLSLHLYSILDSRIRKNNIISLYQTDIIDQNEAIALKKHANKICLIVFIVILAILLFLFFITYMLTRKKTKSNSDSGGFRGMLSGLFGKK